MINMIFLQDKKKNINVVSYVYSRKTGERRPYPSF